MKKNLFISVLFLGLSFTSCTDLTEKVYSDLEEGSFYQNEADLLSSIVPVYATLRNLTEWQQWWDLEESTDIVMTPTRGGSGWFDGGIYQRIHLHTWQSQDVHFETVWNQCFSAINMANRVIYQLDNVSFEVSSKDEIKAELKVMRAYWYYLLIEAFGNVPIVDRFDVEEGFLPTTSDRKAVFEFIEKDLLDNINLLSDDISKTYGRCNQYVAKMLLARLYLNSEAWIGIPKYQECEQLCTEIINSKKYSLEKDYSSPFAVDNEKSSEIIFAVPFDEAKSGGTIYMALQKTLHPSSKDTWSIETWLDNGVCAVPSFIDYYEDGDLRKEKTWLMGQQYAADGVTELKCVGLVAGWNNKPLNYTQEVSSLENAGEPDGYRCHKYEIKTGCERTLDNDWVAMRYTEVLYMKAECLLRLGKNLNEAAELVNQVRDRAFEEGKKSPLTVAQLQEEILVNGAPVKFGRMLIEWGQEFALEGLRRSQLIRFDKNFIKGKWTFHEPSNDENKLLFPIPFNILQSNPNIVQNPGY